MLHVLRLAVCALSRNPSRALGNDTLRIGASHVLRLRFHFGPVFSFAAYQPAYFQVPLDVRKQHHDCGSDFAQIGGYVYRIVCYCMSCNVVEFNAIQCRSLMDLYVHMNMNILIHHNPS